ncbi:hypothetical protein Fcan01_24951 [Folsomia candida]|uniref:Uncharacterized protein n=1 Tax=Folsomia candida TaxID=158441 RepID=A0A226D5F7_FOLCA|nr:hypothetical protein Fcan01_24951 [Folsomia candida]
MSTPLLHNIILSHPIHSRCHWHLAFQSIQVENYHQTAIPLVAAVTLSAIPNFYNDNWNNYIEMWNVTANFNNWGSVQSSRSTCSYVLLYLNKESTFDENFSVRFSKIVRFVGINFVGNLNQLLDPPYTQSEIRTRQISGIILILSFSLEISAMKSDAYNIHPFYNPVINFEPEVLNYVENFAILFLPRDNYDITICLHHQLSFPYLKNFQCEKTRHKFIFAAFTRLRVPPQYWHFDGQRLNMDRYLALRKEGDDHWTGFSETSRYIMYQVVKSVNASLVWAFPCVPRESGNSNLTVIYYRDECLYPVVSYDLPRFQTNHRYTSTHEIVLTTVDAYQFVTCYTEYELSFRFYLRPFHPQVWISIGTTLSSLAVIVSLYLKLAGNLKFPVLIFFLGSVFEEGYPIPGKLKNLSIFRLLTWHWCLFAVVLTNCYTGGTIDVLNSKLNQVTPTTFQDLVCSQKTLPSEAGRIKLIRDAFGYPDNPKFDKDCFALYSFPLTYDIDYQKMDQYTFFRSVLTNLMYRTIIPPNLNEALYTFINFRHRYFPKLGQGEHNLRRAYHKNIETVIQKDLLTCGKSVFIEKSKKLVPYREKLNKWVKSDKLKISRDKILETSYLWKFDVPKEFDVPRKFVRLLESGIYGEMDQLTLRYGKKDDNFSRRGNYLGGGETSDLSGPPLKLGSSIQTVFYIVLMLLGVACVAFLVEETIKI